MDIQSSPATILMIAHDTAILVPVFRALLTDPLIDPRRLERAAHLLDDVERLADGRWICPASDGKAAYHITQGLCNCPDATYRDARRCAHALAVRAYQLRERAEAEAQDPTAADADAAGDPPRCPTCQRLADHGCINEDGDGLWTCDDHGDWEGRDPAAPIPFALTARARAALDPTRPCAGCDDTAADHDGPEGQCTRRGADAEGWWACPCAGFQTDDEGAA